MIPNEAFPIVSGAPVLVLLHPALQAERLTSVALVALVVQRALPLLQVLVIYLAFVQDRP